MATVASLFVNDLDYFALNFYPAGHPIRGYEEDVEGFPPDNPLLLRWNADKLEHGEYECIGLTALALSQITEQHIRDLDIFMLPHVDIPEQDVYDASVGDVLRWAKRTHAVTPIAAGIAPLT